MLFKKCSGGKKNKFKASTWTTGNVTDVPGHHPSAAVHGSGECSQDTAGQLGRSEEVARAQKGIGTRGPEILYCWVFAPAALSSFAAKERDHHDVHSHSR